VAQVSFLLAAFCRDFARARCFVYLSARRPPPQQTQCGNRVAKAQVIGCEKNAPRWFNWIESRLADRRGEEPQSQGNSCRIDTTELRVQFCALSWTVSWTGDEYMLIGSAEKGLIG
jgi:hypothetical protein